MNKRITKILLIIILIISVIVDIGVGIALGFYNAILSTGFNPTALFSILGFLSSCGTVIPMFYFFIHFVDL